jgi:hypothetical protein
MNLWKRFCNIIHDDIIPDEVVVVKPNITINRDPKSLKPSPEFLASIPHLGADHDKMVARAMELYTDDYTRIQWIKSLHSLRSTSQVGWVLDNLGRGGMPSRKPGWGLTSTFTGSGLPV